MKYRIIRNALRQTKGRLKQGFDFAKTVFQTTLMAGGELNLLCDSQVGFVA